MRLNDGMHRASDGPMPPIASAHDLEPHHGLTEVLMGELSAPRNLDVEIQFIHDEDALVAIEIVPEHEPGDQTIKVTRDFTLEDFVTTRKFPCDSKTEEAGTVPFRRSAPYELVELAEPEVRCEASVASAAVGRTSADFTRRLRASDFAATFRTTGSFETGWFAVSEDSIAKLEIDELTTPTARPRLYVTVLLLSAFAVALGVGIAMFAL